MTCRVCKSNLHIKSKCLDKDRVMVPIYKRPRGRPRKDGAQPFSSQAGPLSDHLGAIAQPTKTGRGGRVIKGGRGSKGGRGGRRNAGSNVRSLNFL